MKLVSYDLVRWDKSVSAVAAQTEVLNKAMDALFGNA